MSKTPAVARGYSLIEILVVLVIIGILATAGVWMSQSPIPAAVKAATSSLNGALRNAQTLALSSGQPVYLQPTGVGTTSPGLEWGFCTVNSDLSLSKTAPVLGSWVLTPSESRYLAIGGASDLSAVITGGCPTPESLAAIKLQRKAASVWTRTFFTSGDATYYFMGNGAINQEFFVTVAGARSGSVFSSGNRLGLILVSPASGISVYLKQNPAAATPAWSRQ